MGLQIHSWGSSWAQGPWSEPSTSPRPSQRVSALRPTTRKTGHSTLFPVPGPVRASQHLHQHGPKSDSLRVSPEFERLFSHGEEVKAAYICRKPWCLCREAAGMDKNKGIEYEDGRHPLQSPWASLTLLAPGASALCSCLHPRAVSRGQCVSTSPMPEPKEVCHSQGSGTRQPPGASTRQGTRGVPGPGAHFSPFVRIQSMPIWRPAVVERKTVISVCKQGV